MEIRDKYFSEKTMFKRLKKVATDENLSNLSRALDYAKEKHKNEFRKQSKFNKNIKIPYIIHPLMMTCHAHALGIKDDKVLTVCMLHDICEDCDILPEDLPFDEDIIISIKRLTKNDFASTKDYYAEIERDSTAAIVKALDRVNNISTMSSAFTIEKEIEYIDETEKYVYPLFDKIKYDYEQYSDAIFVLKYHLVSLVETIKCLIEENKK